jgi:flavin reductase (DIM6/NTAB) family NADH-FMN oxidoreductase RutF
VNDKVGFDAAQVIAPLPVVLVGCAHAELGLNLLTIAWTGIDCSDPPAIHVSIRPERHSHRMIADSGCFTVNLPSRALLRQVDLCGIVSGRDGDKWRRAGLTPLSGTAVAAPLVAECPVNFECAVKHVVPLGVHTMFVGEVVARHADDNLVRGGRLDFSKLALVAYVNGEYWSLGERIGTHGFSGRERA